MAARPADAPSVTATAHRDASHDWPRAAELLELFLRARERLPRGPATDYLLYPACAEVPPDEAGSDERSNAPADWSQAATELRAMVYAGVTVLDVNRFMVLRPDAAREPVWWPVYYLLMERDFPQPGRNTPYPFVRSLRRVRAAVVADVAAGRRPESDLCRLGVECYSACSLVVRFGVLAMLGTTPFFVPDGAPVDERPVFHSKVIALPWTADRTRLSGPVDMDAQYYYALMPPTTSAHTGRRNTIGVSTDGRRWSPADGYQAVAVAILDQVTVNDALIAKSKRVDATTVHFGDRPLDDTVIGIFRGDDHDPSLLACARGTDATPSYFRVVRGNTAMVSTTPIVLRTYHPDHPDDWRYTSVYVDVTPDVAGAYFATAFYLDAVDVTFLSLLVDPEDGGAALGMAEVCGRFASDLDWRRKHFRANGTDTRFNQFTGEGAQAILDDLHDRPISRVAYALALARLAPAHRDAALDALLQLLLPHGAPAIVEPVLFVTPPIFAARLDATAATLPEPPARPPCQLCLVRRAAYRGRLVAPVPSAPSTPSFYACGSCRRLLLSLPAKTDPPH